jgi:hypothetical protein
MHEAIEILARNWQPVVLVLGIALAAWVGRK